MTVTHWILIAITVALLAFNVWAVFGSPPTISEVVWSVIRRWPMLPFVVGVVCGHLFWGR